jgi:hypothetical protein
MQGTVQIAYSREGCGKHSNRAAVPVMKGYDTVQVDTQKYMIVLNRKALVIQDKGMKL